VRNHTGSGVIKVTKKCPLLFEILLIFSFYSFFFPSHLTISLVSASICSWEGNHLCPSNPWRVWTRPEWERQSQTWSEFLQHFNLQLSCWYFFAKKLQSQTVIREKLWKAISYKKAWVKYWLNWHLMQRKTCSIPTKSRAQFFPLTSEIISYRSDKTL